ncbi:MAG: hypothetical protein IJY42_04820, partial [Clostridia bacterium]|nr:hypothetical protein [Clostridia bacterium]
MKALKKLVKAMLFPYVAVLSLLVPLSAALLIYSFVYAQGEGMLSYVSYILSAYTLTVLCFRIPQIIAFVKQVKTQNRYISRLLANPALRVKLSLYGSLLFNTAYAIFQMGLGFYHGSFWFHSLAIYYLLLALMRFFLLRDARATALGENIAAEYRRYRFCGVVLLFMNLALASIIFFITYFGRTFEHHAITTIAMAAYTFTSFTVAIVNMVKYRKYNSPVMSAAWIINLAAATVSMLTLETSMLTAFGA